MTTLDAAAALVEIPEGCVPEHGITIISFLDEEGESMYVFGTHGDSTRSGLVGLLQMVSHQLVHMALEDE